MMTGSAEQERPGHIRTPYQLLLIITVILAAYYPSAFGSFSRVDDHDIVKNVGNMGSLNLHDLFIPHMKNGGYYRPFIFVSYYADKFLFNLDPGFMHLHNIILHAINALLIFWLVRQLTGDRKHGKNLLPLLSALVFGLHPITTEPVSWIGGRTDVLACTFILLSANCIILFKKEHSYGYVALSALFMSLGFLTKEVAIAFLPGAFLILNCQLAPPLKTFPLQGISSYGFMQRYRNLLPLLFGFGAILLFFLLRSFAIESNSGRIIATIKFIRSDAVPAGLISLKALGFYVKKIFFPFPLNFAITDLDPLYDLLGVPVIVLCFFIISKRNIASALFMTGILLIMPSFLIALAQIAWTPFAERYMYLPAAFIMVALILIINSFMEKIPLFAARIKIAIMLLLAVMAVATFHRSMVWKDNLSLMRDTVDKNPDFYIIRGQYADELAMHGDIKNSRMQYIIANEYNKNKKRLKNAGDFIQLQYWEMPELGLADLLVREHKIPEAIAAYEAIIRDSKGESTESVQALNNVILLLDGSLNDTKSYSNSDRIKKKMSIYADKLYKRSDDANIFYWLGKSFLLRGEKREALNYFKKAESKFNPDSEYKVIAQKFIARLEN